MHNRIFLAWDIKIFVKVEAHPNFQRKGLDLCVNQKISLKEALCGFSFDLKYINGKVYTINNQAGNVIPSEYNKVIPNMGLTRDSHVGNLIIVFHVEFPEKIPIEKIDLFSSPVWKVKIPPNSYNKQEILDVVEYNYNLQLFEERFNIVTG